MAPTATIEIQVDLPDSITIGEDKRIGEGHAVHASFAGFHYLTRNDPAAAPISNLTSDADS